jgi:hypothetical protein
VSKATVLTDKLHRQIATLTEAAAKEVMASAMAKLLTLTATRRTPL